jgi:deoxyribose-phosphate aldolase
MINLNRETLVTMIDHTDLRAFSGAGRIGVLCREALDFGFYAVCVNGAFTRHAAEQLAGSRVRVATVIGFPLGAGTSSAKAHEARDAVRNGAAEIDMVIAISALHEKKPDRVRDDIRAVVEASRPALVKVILETCYLTDEEIVLGCHLSVEAGALYVKTSTGFGPSGAVPEHVRLMRRTVGPAIGVKASGGIRTIQDALRMIEAGASRLGTSAGMALVEGLSTVTSGPAAGREE